MELRPEYQKIFDKVGHEYLTALPIKSPVKALKVALEAAQALADKPPKELTDAFDSPPIEVTG